MRVSGPIPRARKRSAKILVLFVLLLPVLLGMLGLALEAGLAFAALRQTQNAADAAALAAATDLLRGRGASTARTTAETYVWTHNGLSGATVSVNIPPTGGNYAGNSAYAEIVVGYPITLVLLPVLGVSSTQTVEARAVAGYEAVSAGEGVGVLDPTNNAGLSVTSTNANLLVRGRIVVNAKGVSGGQAAVSANHQGGIKAKWLDVVGNVDNPSYIEPPEPGDTVTINTGATPEPDPLINLPTPTISNGVLNRYPSYLGSGNFDLTSAATPQDVTINSNETVTIPPGIYRRIAVTSGNVTFAPGIFVLAGGGMSLGGNQGATINGSGVMFYNTGPLVNTNQSVVYNPITGGADANDATTYNPVPGTSNPTVPPGGNFQNDFGDISITAANGVTINLSPSTTSTDTFKGILLYQRRANTKTASVTGSGGTLNVGGTIYAQWARFIVSGGGSYNAQFIVGSIQVSGSGTLTINYAGQNTGRANQIFLVE